MNNSTNKTTEDKPRTDTLKEPILEEMILIAHRPPQYSRGREVVVGYTVREEDEKCPKK